MVARISTGDRCCVTTETLKKYLDDYLIDLLELLAYLVERVKLFRNST